MINNPKNIILAFTTLFLLLSLATCQSSTTTPPSQQISMQPQSNANFPPINFTQLNHKLETLDKNYLPQFSQTFTVQRITMLNQKEIGNYLFLLGKMYIYDILPDSITVGGEGDDKDEKLRYSSKSRYLLGYFYLQMAAETYENGDAYYYLAVLQYMKLTPTTLIKNNLKTLLKTFKTEHTTHKNQPTQKLLKQISQIKTMDNEQIIEYLDDLTYDMQTHHLHNTEHNLYLASVLGQNPAKFSLAYMLKQGISTDKNCSASIPYYLSAIRETKISTFQFPSDYVDRKSFQRELYNKQKVDLRGYGQYDPSVLMDTVMFDEQSHSAYEEVAMKYMTGQDGFPINEALAVQMLQRITKTSRLARIMLGFMYLKGRGVSKDYKKARQLLETDQHISKVSKQTIIAMKFYNMGYEGKKNQALTQMQALYLQYEKRNNQSLIIPPKKTTTQKAQKKQQQPAEEQNKDNEQAADNKKTTTKSKNYHDEKTTIRTPMIKYLIGSLVLSEEIKGSKNNAINLIDQAAKQGNTLALTLLGLLFLDGSDASYDCQKSANYFSKQALSNPAFQQRIQLAKIGIKHQKYMFSFIKYVQLMLVGYKNAFINALYLVEVYGEDVFGFQKESWSVEDVKGNQVYKMLVEEDIVEKVDEYLFQSFGLDIDNVFTVKNMQYLTLFSPQQTPTSTSAQTSTKTTSLHQQYTSYIILKITSIGILKHDISILRFYKYKQTKDINTLNQLANLGQNSPHVYQSRFLLGQYYHHTNISGSQQDVRLRRAIQQYNRATKNKFLGWLVYMVEGGEFKEGDRILTHFYTYLTVIVVLGLILYRTKNKKMEEILEKEHRKFQEQNNLAQDKQQHHHMQKQNQNQPNQSPPQQQYKGPKFSEEQAQNMINHRNLLNINMMMDQKMNDIKRQKEARQESELNLRIDKDQPVIVEDDAEEDGRQKYD